MYSLLSTIVILKAVHLSSTYSHRRNARS